MKRRFGPGGPARLPVLVFAKPPRAGEAKTRLAAGLGPAAAAELAGAFFDDTWSAVAALPWARPILVTTEPAAREWRHRRVGETWAQGDGDLGTRLGRAFERALATSPAALAVGTDAPGLPPQLLAAARASLDSADAVLGPCEDGGFYLLGLRRCPNDLLAGLPWSSAETLARTYERLTERGLSVHLLPTWFDVDQVEDLDALRRRLDRGDIAAPATARALARIGPASPRVSVVLPVLDEQARIEAQLRALAAVGTWHELIVVDGGSADRTVERARSIESVRVIESARGRGAQMNRGAHAATGDVLLFLHADVRLPADALAQITGALADPAVIGGAFRTWTVADGGRSRLGPLLHLADLRSRYSRVPYGDQAIFVRAAAFARLGGFPELPLMEDVAFSRRLRRLGRIRTVPARVEVSGRRFLARPLYYFFAMNVLPLLFALGVPAARLARLYGNPR